LGCDEPESAFGHLGSGEQMVKPALTKGLVFILPPLDSHVDDVLLKTALLIYDHFDNLR